MRKHMMRSGWLLVLFFISLSISAQEVATELLKQHIAFLASDSLKGRYPGTAEFRVAADYIRDQFKNENITLAGKDGFQRFEVITSVEMGKNNKLSFGGEEAKPGVDFIPLSFTENKHLEAEAVFCGYGFEIKSDSNNWSDYEGVDVNDKWVLILRGYPEPDNLNSPYAQYGMERDKVILAKEKGAAGVLFVNGPENDERDELIPLSYDKSKSGAGIPVIHMKREIANNMLSGTEKKIEELENELNNNKKPHSFELSVAVVASADVLQKKVTTFNVMAMIEGHDPLLKNEYLVIGAHYDHLGMGGPGSGSRNPDTFAIHNGADDNASGVAGILELARIIKNQPPLKRSLVFVAFSAEEMGLLGSKYFTKNPVIPIRQIKTMFNLDMIGRFDNESKVLTVGGTGTSGEAESILQKYAEQTGLDVKFSAEGYGPSDHASFYAEDIPVFFFSTGAHGDYHMPEDDFDHINFEGMEEVIQYCYEVIRVVANRDQPLIFREAGPKESISLGKRFKVTLGIMPDFASTEKSGLRVDGVTKNRPAWNGGMKKGDIITAMNGNPVTNIYDYMFYLKKLEPGQTITVDVIREGKKMVLLIPL